MRSASWSSLLLLWWAPRGKPASGGVEPGTDARDVLVVEVAGEVGVDQSAFQPGDRVRIRELVVRQRVDGGNEALIRPVVVGHQLIRRPAGVVFANPVIDAVIVVELRRP